MVQTAAQLRARTRQTLARQQIKQPTIQELQQQAKQQAEQQQKELAKKQQEQIEDSIKSLKDRLEQLQEKIRTTSGKTSENLNERANELQERINSLLGVKKLATGQYTTQSLFSLASSKVSSKLQRIESKKQFEFQSQETLNRLKEQGLNPIFVKGKLTGFEDLINQRSISVGELQKEIASKIVGTQALIAPKEFIAFENIASGEKVSSISRPSPDYKRIVVSASGKKIRDANIRDIFGKDVQTRRLPTNKELRESLLTVERTPNTLEQLKNTILEQSPELKSLGKSAFSNFVRQVIGTLKGSKKFTEEKITGFLSKQKDVKGNFIFTPDQARGLVRIGSEVATNYALGSTIGKVTTIGKVGISKLLPETIKGSKTIQTLSGILDYGAAIGLTTFELNRLKKVAQTQGVEEAIFQLIGTASFGVGFAKTGLRTSKEAEAEFGKLAQNLKKTIPKSKKGQVQLLLKKKKKSFRDIEIIDEVEKAEAIQGAVEKRLLKAKSNKEQLQILSEIASKVKTSTQKSNFKKFVQNLIDKSILKVPTVEITGEAITTKGIIEPQVKITKLGSVSNQKKISKSLQKSREKLEFSKLSLGDRFKLAQDKISQSKVLPFELTQTKLKNISQQIQKLQSKVFASSSVKQKQVLRQQILSLQKQRLKTLQKERQSQKSAQLLASSQAQIQKQKTLQAQQTKQATKLANLLYPGLSQLQIKKLVSRTIRGGRGIGKGRPRPRPFKLLFPPLLLDGKKKKKKVKKKKKIILGMKSYNVLGKIKGKFRKLNKVPLTKQKASDLGSYLVDRSTARTFKLSPIDKPSKKPILKVPNNYFTKNMRKFRDFRLRKGKKIKLKDIYIEKSKNLIDTKEEKQQLSLARARSKLIRKQPKSKVTTPKLKTTRLIKLKRSKK